MLHEEEIVVELNYGGDIINEYNNLGDACCYGID